MDATVFAIQRLYPRIFHACHVRHVRRRSTPFDLGEKESSLLAHLDPDSGSTARVLRAHMGVGAPAMSATLERLERRGYVLRERSPDNRREVMVRITELGTKALSAASVLDTDRLRALVDRLTPAQQRAAVRGLALLAQAGGAAKKEALR